MTEPLPPLSDEDLSAYLDHEVTPEVRARIEGDPRAQQRVRTLASAREAVKTAPVTPPPGDVFDSMISRALAELESAPDAPPAPLAPPRSIQQRRRRGGSAPSTPWMVAAAVVALVAVGLGLVWSGVQSTETSDVATSGAGQQTARSADSDAAPESDGGTDSAESSADDSGAGHSAFPTPPPVSTEPAELIDLGTASDGDELRTSLRDGLPAAADTTTSDATEGAEPGDEVITVGQVDRCAQILELQVAPDSDLSKVGLSSVDGDPHLVYEFDLPEDEEVGDHLITAVDPASCAALITFVR